VPWPAARQTTTDQEASHTHGYTCHAQNLYREVLPREVLLRINDNAYQVQFPNHLRKSNVFNVKHLTPYRGDPFGDDLNSRSSSVQPREEDADK